MAKQKSARKLLTKQLDKLCLEIVRLRDDNRCQHCYKYITGSNSQPSHIVAKGNGASWRRFDLLNIVLKCNPCHRWWHLNPTESGKWFCATFPARYEYLDKYRNGQPAKISTPEMRELAEQYREKLDDLKKEAS